LGEVARVKNDSVLLKLDVPLKAGDGVVFDSGHPEETEEGGRVYEVRSPERGVRNEKLFELHFGRGDLDFSRIHAGDKVWKTSDPELNRKLRQTFAGDQPRFQRAIDFEAHGQLGKPLIVIARDELGNVPKAQSTMPLER